MTRPPLLFYCQHSVGMGHLMRSLALTRSLSTRFDVTFVSGGAVPRIAATGGLRLVPLPPVGLDERGRMVSRDGRRTLERALDARRRLLIDTYRAVRPRVVVVELFPFGRRKFSSEIEPILELARGGSPRPLVCCSLRDILVSGRATQREHDARAAGVLDTYFDAVLVHSDPSFARLEDSLASDVRISVPIHYTGFVHAADESAPVRARTRPSSVVVSAGGGLVGEPLLQTAIESYALISATLRRPLTLVCGPFLPEEAWRRLRRRTAGMSDVAVCRAVPNLALELTHASASISQCGYNTAMDLLQSRVPALVVPFGTSAEDEQLKRARRLEALGALRVLLPSELTAPRLAAEMVSLPSFRPVAPRLTLRGAERTTEVIDAMLDGRALGRSAPFHAAQGVV